MSRRMYVGLLTNKATIQFAEQREAAFVYPPVVITKDRRAEYYEALDLAYTTLDYSKFIQLISDFLVESESLWLLVIN